MFFKKKKCGKIYDPFDFGLITFIAGIPRSGKSYSVMFALSALEDEYNISTNITGAEKTYNSFYELDVLEPDGKTVKIMGFLTKVKLLHIRYMELLGSSEDRDSALREYQKELDFFYFDNGRETLVAFDECQSIFRVSSATSSEYLALSWFLSYIARFKIRLIMMTQYPGLLGQNYTKFTGAFYLVKNPEATFSNNIVVSSFYGIPDLIASMTKGSKNVISSFTIKKYDCIFEKFSTPNFKKKGGSLLKPYLKYIAGGIFLVIFGVYKVYSMISPDKGVSPSFPESSSRPFAVKTPKPLVSPAFDFDCSGNICINVSLFKDLSAFYNESGYLEVIKLRDLLNSCGAVEAYENKYKIKKLECYYDKKFYISRSS